MAARLYEDAVSRAYYAMFHAARAVLYTRGITTKTHSGLITSFGIEIAEKGIVDREYGRMLNRAFNLRQKSDYETGSRFKREDVAEMLENAEKFVQIVKAVIDKGNKLA
ncbi:MAG: HEPN domain-containing protein [Chloroflexi bacterium]|jgi:uncharacterized protein (UPF0332 family)|nr:HEPN domain-containing protein [Chloroflexota bacterium]